MRRIRIGKEPEQQGGNEYAQGIHLWQHLPAESNDDYWRHQMGQRSSCVTYPKHAHRKTFAFRLEPARNIRRANGERTAGQSDKQPQHQEMPILAGVAQQENRYHAAHHQPEEDYAAAEAIGPDAQRHPRQRTREYGSRQQQAELGFIEPQLRLERNAQNREHHPHCKANGECESTANQYRKLLIFNYHDNPP